MPCPRYPQVDLDTLVGIVGFIKNLSSPWTLGPRLLVIPISLVLDARLLSSSSRIRVRWCYKPRLVKTGPIMQYVVVWLG
jgi:hypothetical protein